MPPQLRAQNAVQIHSRKPPKAKKMGICLCLVILYFNLPMHIAIPAQCHRHSSASLYFVTIFTHPLKIAIFKNLTNYRIRIKIPHHYKIVNLKTSPKTARNCILMPRHYKQFAMEAIRPMPLCTCIQHSGLTECTANIGCSILCWPRAVALMMPSSNQVSSCRAGQHSTGSLGRRWLQSVQEYFWIKNLPCG